MAPSAPFVFQGSPTRVIFGRGTLDRVADELRRLGRSRALVLSSPRAGRAEALAASLGPLAVGSFREAVMHTPVGVTARAVQEVRRTGADCVVAIGGGSTVGLAKAIALATDLDQIIVPTAYSGSEMTPLLGQTADGVKTTQRSPKILPETVIYDVDLTLDLPKAFSMTSGLNAIAHGVEALYAHNGNPVVSIMAEQGIRSLAEALPRLQAAEADVEARSGALYGAWLCSSCVGLVDVALHHKLCHVLGGSFGLPHAETHAVVLPHAVAFNAPAVPEAMAILARALAHAEPAGALYDLAGRLGVPRSLASIGMPADGLDRAAEIASRDPYPNPRPFDRATLRSLLQNAFDGRRPVAQEASTGTGG